jgi:23S rRNA (adenine2503-C2)-methyltransferase
MGFCARKGWSIMLLESLMDVKSLTLEEIAEVMKSIGQPSFRAKQIFDWLHKGVENFGEMTNLPKGLQVQLAQIMRISVPKFEKRLVSNHDNTVKYIYRLFDGECIETVFMEYHHGNSVCISTQAGCKMGCSFCASTMAGFGRNLTPAEMLDQVIFTQKDTGKKISNIVLMGIGEPLDNFDNVIKFLNLVSREGVLNIGMRHISLSTCGLVDKIESLMELKLQLTLSVSLHAPNNEIRNQIMPVNQKWNIEQLLHTCKKYSQETGRRITFEYAMLDGTNDTSACANELVKRLKGTLSHVNLIPANSVKGRNHHTSSPEKVRNFASILEKSGINITVRRTLGADIDASCGQLRRDFKVNTGDL